jgi:hypothetical protein
MGDFGDFRRETRERNELGSLLFTGEAFHLSRRALPPLKVPQVPEVYPVGVFS